MERFSLNGILADYIPFQKLASNRKIKSGLSEPHFNKYVRDQLLERVITFDVDVTISK
jgi:hypothetical protein